MAPAKLCNEITSRHQAGRHRAVRHRQSPRHQVQFKKLRTLNEKKKSVHQILPWDFAIFLVQDVNQLLVKWFTQGINLDNIFNMNIFFKYAMHCEIKQKSFKQCFD